MWTTDVGESQSLSWCLMQLISHFYVPWVTFYLFHKLPSKIPEPCDQLCGHVNGYNSKTA